MKISNLFIILIAILITSGCASKFTSIAPTDNPDEYYVTDTHQRFFVPPAGSLYKCTAKGSSMDCVEVGG